MADSPPPLQAEDRPEFELLLEEALRDERVRQALHRADGQPTAALLHSRALRDMADIAAAAAPQYARFVQLRDQVYGTPAPGQDPDPKRPGPSSPAPGTPLADDWAGSDSDRPLTAAEQAGLVPLLAVIATVLSWLSALVLWLIGATVHASDPQLLLGRQLTTAARAAAYVGVAVLLADTIGLVLTWRRDATAAPEQHHPELYQDFVAARTAWRVALRDRALLPYLYRQLGIRDSSVPPVPAPRKPVSLVREKSKLGFSSPGFTSPGVEGITDERGVEIPEEEREDSFFTSPGFSSPGVEGITDGKGEEIPEDERDGTPYFTGPRYSSPDFTSPNYEGPGTLPRSRFLPNEGEEAGG